jgi:hypothetical protein
MVKELIFIQTETFIKDNGEMIKKYYNLILFRKIYVYF